MNLPTLYSKSKAGTLWSWKVWTEGNTIKTEFGMVDGAKQIAERIATAKNAGKANATTDSSQAAAEANSMWNHQLERRYRKTLADAQERVFLPMLARSKAVKMTEEKKIKFPADLQIKFDGFRSMAFHEGDNVVFMSRQGKIYSLPHMSKVVKQFLPHGTVLDGEVYHHGSRLQTIQSWAKKLQPDTAKLSYRVYDTPEYGGESGTWLERKAQLAKILSNAPDTKNIVGERIICPVESREVKNLAEAYHIVETEYVPAGYEGGILRLHNGKYLFGGKRSNDLLKLKLFDEDDFEVIGHKYGAAGSKEAKAVIWKCKTASGYVFDVRPTGTIEEREITPAEAKKFYGEMYSVKYKGISEDGCPLYPVGLAFKEDR